MSYSLKGHIAKDGGDVYTERLDNGLLFIITCTYAPYYAGSNSANHQSSSQLICEAIITNGIRHTWGNGIISHIAAVETEIADEKGNFKPLAPELKTKEGFRVWQKDYQYSSYEEKGKTIKTRNLIWLVEVPKKELLNFCIK